MENTNQQTPQTVQSTTGRAFQDFLREADQVYRNQNSKTALKLLGRLEELRTIAKANSIELETHRLRLQAIALSLLPIEQLAQLFAQPLGEVLEFRLADRLRTRLLSLPADIREKLQAELLQSLSQNRHSLGGPASGNPKSWLEAFQRAGQSSDEFMRTDPAVQKLSIEEQLKIERLLNVAELIYGNVDSRMLEEVVIRDAKGAFQVVRGGHQVAGIPAVSTPNAATQPSTPTPRPSMPRSGPPPAPSPKTATQASPVKAAISPAASRAKSADFYFHPDDEADVSHHRTRLANLEPGKRDFGVTINELIKEFRLVFDSPAIHERFVSIVESRLRDVRDLIETKTMLCRPIEVGGVGLPEDLVMQILAQVEEEAIKVHQSLPRFSLPPVPPPTPPSPAPAAAPQVPVAPPVAKPATIPVSSTAPSTVKPPVPRRVPVEAPPSAQRAPAMPVPSIKRPTVVGRPMVSDIKRPVKVLSPVEELQSLTLDDYRKLGRNLQEINDKVVEKLDLLEEDSYLKRAEGVQAWKKSETYQLYLAIGRESMERNLSITDVISRREAEHRPTMSPQEFESIADLNRRISY